MLVGILLIMAGVAGWGEGSSSLNRALSSAPRFLARSWDENSGITAGFEPDCALDGDVNTYWASNAPTRGLPKDVGVEWERPVSLRGCAIAYVVQSGISYAPHRQGYRLEAWQGGRWREVAHETRERLASAPAYGLVWWEHRFAVPVRTTRLRVVVTRAEQRPAIAEWVLEGSGPRAVSWDEQEREHSLGTMSGLNDGDLGRLVEVHGRPHGLRWEVPQRLRHVALALPVCGPLRPGQAYWDFFFSLYPPSNFRLEVERDGTFRPAGGLPGVDLRQVQALSSVTPVGVVRWCFNFDGLETSCLRIVPLGSSPPWAELEAYSERGPPGEPPPAVSPYPWEEWRRQVEQLPARWTGGEPTPEVVQHGTFRPPLHGVLGWPAYPHEIGVTHGGDLIFPSPYGAGEDFFLGLRWPGGEKPSRITVRQGGKGLDWRGPAGQAARVACSWDRGRPALQIEAGEGTGLALEWHRRKGFTPLHVALETRGGGCQVVLPDGTVVLQAHFPVALWQEKRTWWVQPRPSSPDSSWRCLLPMPPQREPPSSQKGAPPRPWGTLTWPASVVLPDPELNRLWRDLLYQLLLSADGDVMPYGTYPSVYEGTVFGVEEGWPMLALAEWGLVQRAQELLKATYFNEAHLAKYGQHHQYRNGLSIQYALAIYELSGDREWLQTLLPHILTSADWIVAQTRATREASAENGQTLHRGLLPKFTYGGDISAPAYALYGNACCWRGLRDAGLICEHLGKPARARRYLREAAAYRQRILHAVDQSIRWDVNPPYLPLSLYEGQPEPPHGDYYQLFAALLLETGIFDLKGERAGLLTDYLTHHNRLLYGLSRFAGGLDAHYSKGTVRSFLRQDRIEEYLAAFYAFLHYNRGPHHTFPEVVQIFPDPRLVAWQQAQEFHSWGAGSDPNTSGPGIVLSWLRSLLVYEERDGEDRLTGTLWLCPATPRAWLSGPSPVVACRLPTAYGAVSFKVQPGRESVRVRLYPPTRGGCKTLSLRLRLPQGKQWGTVKVGKRPWSAVDREREVIILPNLGQPLEVEVTTGTVPPPAPTAGSAGPPAPGRAVGGGGRQGPSPAFQAG